jgi:serine/threonine protein kinase
MGSIEDFCAFGGKLGEGGGGIVSEVRTEGFPVQLVGKAVRKSNSTGGGSDLSSWRKIAEVLLNVSHPHVVQLHEVIEDDKMFYTVMERCHGGTLLSYIRDHRRIPITSVKNFGQQVISAVASLHSRGILHRDLKPDNILIANEGQEVVKIADFDLCAFVGEDGLFISSVVQGTGGFLAPEAIVERRYSVQSDIFAFGCVLHFLMFRQPALSGIKLEKGTNPAEVAAKTIAEAERAINRSQDAASGGIHAEARQLINSCLSVDPHERPCSAIEVWSHKFLASQGSRKVFAGKSQPNNGQYARFLSSFRSPTADATQCEPCSNH